MKQQNFENHIRFYPPHHFILLPIVFITIIFGAYKYFQHPDLNLVWLLFAVSSFFILFLTLMVRQHYALTLQNRIVKLEFRQRYFEFTDERSERIISSLKFDQISELRFASDEEFLDLLQKALNNNLTGK